jgi:hypothetical protein
MNSDNGGLGRAFTVLLLVLAIMIGVAACGAPVIDRNGLSWDNSLWANREAQRTERERIQANRDIRIEAQRSETMQAFLETAGKALIVAAIVFGMAKALPPIVASLATAFAAWAARPHRTAGVQQIEVRISYEQAQRLAQPHLAALPDARLEWIDGAEIDGVWVAGWAVVDDVEEIVRPLQLTDSQHGNSRLLRG